MANILCQIGNISGLKFTLTVVRVVGGWLNVLLALGLAIVTLVGLHYLIGGMLAHIVDHVCLGLHQKACGFVQCKILSCLRASNLSGIELLTDLGLSAWIGSSVGVLMPTALGSHINIVLLVVELAMDRVVLLHALNYLGLLNIRDMDVRVVILNLF
jgi:hypothetical protein